MGLFDKVEKGIERTVNRAFAKAFKAEVAPVEVASALRRAMDERATPLGHGRTMVPNLFTVDLAPSDFARYDEYSDAISDDLIAAAQEHAETQAYTPGGPIEVRFEQAQDLETGVFRVHPSTSKRSVASGAGMPDGPLPEFPSPDAPVPSASGPAVSPVHAPVGSPVHAPSADPEIIPWAERLATPDPVQGPVQPPAAPAPPVSPPPRVNPAQRPWLDIDGERYPLLGAHTVVGRDPAADVILDDPGISRRHTEIRVTHDGPHLVSSVRDLASTNGTFVNGERIASTRLIDGDQITVGRTAITFRAGKR